MCPRATSSMESAMTSRLTSEVFIPSVPIVMPSEMAIVLNSIGLAPAARMPAFKGPASSRSPKLHGIVSLQQLETPTNGLPMSADVRPIAWRNERAAARSRPWYSVRLGSSRAGTVGSLARTDVVPSLRREGRKLSCSPARFCGSQEFPRSGGQPIRSSYWAVSYTHLRAHETRHDLVCRLLLEKKKKKNIKI